MKRTVSLLVALLMVAALSFAAVTDGNRQMVYPVGSQVMDAIKYLYIAEGRALPSYAGPWSAQEVDMMMDRLDPEEMDASKRHTYDWIMKEIGKVPRIAPTENFGAQIGMRTTLEATYHTNAVDFISADSIGGRGDWRPQKPLISVPLETWIGKHIYGYSALEFGVTRSFNSGFKDYNLLTNIWMVPPSTLGELSLNFPLRAIGSLGGEHWNFVIGKEKVEWGPGESGNLMLGDQIPFHNTARFTGFAEHFKYTFIMSSFPHPMNYTEHDDTDKDLVWLKSCNEDPYSGPMNENRVCDYDQSAAKDGINMFIGHRLEWRIVEKVGMAISEAMMYQSETNKFDLMVLSPTAVFHNAYMRGNSNSLLSFDIDYTPIDYLNIYGSFIVDEFEMPGEIGTSYGPPSAHGWIFGAKTGVPLGEGMLHASLEGAYTDPYLYLRGLWREYDNKDNCYKPYGINFVVATPEFNNASGNYTLDFLGYRYGNDAFVANLDVGYKVWGKWFVDAEYTYLADGTLDMNSRWIFAVPHSEEDPSGPTSEHNDKGSFNKNSNWKERDAVAHWNIISLRGGVTLFEDLDIWGEMNYVNIINYANVSGKTADDLQMTLGISYYL